MLQKLFVIIPYGGFVGMDFYVNLQTWLSPLDTEEYVTIKVLLLYCRLCADAVRHLLRLQ